MLDVLCIKCCQSFYYGKIKLKDYGIFSNIYSILDSINLSDEYSLVEIAPISDWIGKSIKESEVRNRYHVNIVAIKNKEGLEINVDADYVIKDSDILLVAGRNDWIGKLV